MSSTDLKPASSRTQEIAQRTTAQRWVDERVEGCVTGFGKENANEEVQELRVQQPPHEVTRARVIGSVLLSGPVVALAMIPTLQFQHWQWLAIALTSPVALWGAWPFHRAALVNLRQGTASMDTLVSVGVAASYTWSVVVLFLGEVGEPQGHLNRELFIPQGFAGSQIFLETVVVLTTVLLIGRYWQDRGERRVRLASHAEPGMEGGGRPEQMAHPLTNIQNFTNLQNGKAAVQQSID
ncbi:MAG: hypothetical protein ACRDPW_06855, partial [Mycobacteriales bacterium]